MAVVMAVVLLAGCHGGNKKSATPVATIDYSAVKTPEFSADSAYRFVADQVSFGYRTPGSEGQRKCADYLVSQMRRWCDTVIVQEFPTTLWDGREVRGKNIIATVGAQPGSVGVLMELARTLATQRLTVPVDFIFFDVEDQGVPEWADTYVDDSWCKGSQYWSLHPHTPYYTATFGILLDMVGTEQPRYTKEQFSRQYAAGIMNKVWTVAASIGYGDIFVNTETDPILDDHLYVNRLGGIPMIDIVQNNVGCSFFKHWHTMGDNMQHVDKKSLEVIGKVLQKTLYGDYGEKRN